MVVVVVATMVVAREVTSQTIKHGHATATSVVIRAIDKRAGEDNGAIAEVVFKLMKYKKHFDNEQKQREKLNPKYVVPVIHASTDEVLQELWQADLAKLGKWSSYHFGIVMPAAQRNLAVVLLQERVDLALAREIFEFLARALGE